MPIAKATSNGYYKEMLEIMKGLMQALKDNPSLRFAVITGCLKIAKESIFTGINNFVSDTITDTRLNEYFGFVQSEVDQILKDADFTDKADLVKKWYDGYRFGDFDVYCPWDVMCYLRDLVYKPEAKPASYWRNTSDNSIIRSFIDYAGSSITNKLETLMDGGYIIQKIDENLTYDYLHSSEDNLWSMLYLTGYLTQKKGIEYQSELPEGTFALMIPNLLGVDDLGTTHASHPSGRIIPTPSGIHLSSPFFIFTFSAALRSTQSPFGMPKSSFAFCPKLFTKYLILISISIILYLSLQVYAYSQHSFFCTLSKTFALLLNQLASLICRSMELLTSIFIYWFLGKSSVVAL